MRGRRVALERKTVLAPEGVTFLEMLTPRVSEDALAEHAELESHKSHVQKIGLGGVAESLEPATRIQLT